MKILNSFCILSLFICACTSPEEDMAVEVADTAIVQTLEIDSILEPDLPLPPEKTWEEERAILREQLVAGLTNEVLKNSFLQEMYIRKVARVYNDTVYVEIDFNVHGFDCGAPDCYSTDVSFSFPLGDSLIFPKTLPFKEHEYGCVDNEFEISGVFKLVDSDYRYVKYVSSELKRTLLLYSDQEEDWSVAEYFSGIDPERVQYETLDTLCRYLEEEETDFQPYSSFILSTPDYNWFVDKD